jgi:hypothetical protein
MIYIFCFFGWNIKTNKKGASSHYVECFTRQRVPLPSATVIALNKEKTSGDREIAFVECLGQGTPQRLHLCQSATDKVLVKGGAFPECFSNRHSAKVHLYRVSCGELSIEITQGAVVAFFAECLRPRHSLSKGSVIVAHCRHGDFTLPSIYWL